MSSSRLRHIDISRGICIILVVIGHYRPTNSPEWYSILIDIIYCFHMPLFMYISGLVYKINQKPVNYKDFILRKFKRLLIPYFGISALLISIKLVVEKNMYVENPVSISSYYEMFYSPSAGYFLWFIYVLFLIFLIIPFFNSVKKINILLGISFIWLISPIDTTELFCLAQLKSNLFYFVLGCFIGQYKVLRFKIERIPIIFFLGCFITLYFLTFTYTFSFPLILQLLYICIAISGVFIITKTSQFIEKKLNALKSLFFQLSLYSYTIYLFHTTFEGAAKSFFNKFHLPESLGNNSSFWIMSIIIITTGIVGPIILYKIKNIIYITISKKNIYNL